MTTKFDDREVDPMTPEETEVFFRAMVHPQMEAAEARVQMGLLTPPEIALLERPWKLSYLCKSCDKIHAVEGVIGDIGSAASYLMIAGAREIRIAPVAKEGLN